MILKINLKKNNTNEQILFELNDLPHTQRYVKLMNKSFNLGWNKPLYTSYQIKDANKKDKLPYHIKSLNDSIDFFNFNQSEFKIEDKFLQVENQRDYHEILNKIHSQFEEYWSYFNVECIEKIKNLNEINFHLGNINQMVHLIDTEIHHCVNENSYEFYFSTHVGSEKGEIIYEQLKDIDYENFTLTTKFGDLFLGYSTVGKSLIHCWSDQDIEIIKSKKVSPQSVMSTNIIAYFNMPEREHLSVLSDFYRWFDENNLSDYYNKFDKRNSYGYLKIGELINEENLSNSEILSKYSDCEIESFEVY